MYYKYGSFSFASVLGTVKDAKTFLSKKDSKQYTALTVTTSEKYKTKEGEEKSSVSEVKAFVEGTLALVAGNVVLVEGDVGTANVAFKTESKYPVTQAVITNARVQKIADVASPEFSGLNSFEMIGRVGRDPREIKSKTGGSEFCIAVSPKDMETQWIPVLFWGARGKKLVEIAHKGDLVRISARGALATKKVQDEEKKVLSLFGTDLQILKKKDVDSTGASTDTVEQTAIEDDPEDAPF